MRLLDTCRNLLLGPSPTHGLLDAGGSFWSPSKAGIVFINDASGSMADNDSKPTRYKASIHAVQAYNKSRMLAFPGTKVCLCLFDTGAHLAVPPMPVGPGFDAALQRCYKREPGGGTNFIAALEKGRESLDPGADERRLYFLTDGGHGGHQSGVINLANRIKAEGIIIEAVGVGARKEVDEALLLKIVSVVNGKALYRWIGDDATELVRHYGNLAAGGF